VQWMWMFAFLAYCYSVGSVVLPETPDANEAVRGEDADALEASWLASMPADIRAKINKINDETAKELDADRNWPFEDDFPSGQSMTNHGAASFLHDQLDSTDDASTKLNEDPNALKTGLNDPIDIQTKIADEGSSFIEEEASTDSTKTMFNEVGSLPGYFCVAEAEALPDHDCVISPEHAKIQQDCNQIAKERDTVCGFKIGLAGSCKAATNFYHKTCKQNPARKVHHWQGGMGLGKQTNSQALLQESTGDDQGIATGCGASDNEAPAPPTPPSTQVSTSGCHSSCASCAIGTTINKDQNHKNMCVTCPSGRYLLAIYAAGLRGNPHDFHVGRCHEPEDDGDKTMCQDVGPGGDNQANERTDKVLCTSVAIRKMTLKDAYRCDGTDVQKRRSGSTFSFVTCDVYKKVDCDFTCTDGSDRCIGGSCDSSKVVKCRAISGTESKTSGFSTSEKNECTHMADACKFIAVWG